MTSGQRKIVTVLQDPSVRDFCKDIITIGFSKDCVNVIEDVQLALDCLKLRRDEALGSDWQNLKDILGPHLKCAVSTAISGHLTFGSGDCDDYGFWENPCFECARDHERRHPDDGKCWPFRDA